MISIRPHIISVILMLISTIAGSQTVEKQQKHFLTPDYLIFNYAGNIGNYGIGGGYVLNNMQSLQLGLLYGFTPKYKVAVAIHTISARGIYLPAAFELKHGLTFSPQISAGISYNTAVGKNTWITQPSVFPKGYYSPTAFRIHAGFGGKLSLDTPNFGFINKTGVCT